jgi:hypothetical protein
MEEIILSEYIKSKDWDNFQNNTLIYNSEFDNFKDSISNTFSDLGQLKDVFLFQKSFYEDFGVYLVFPIAGKFVYDRATDYDCVWCWNSLQDIDKKTKEKFMEYLLDLVNKYEEEK